MTEAAQIPTPRTEEHIYQRTSEGCLGADYDFARQLERELSQLIIAYGKSVADGLELKRQRDELAGVLRLLHDYQNGCPLPKYEPYWTKAMADAEKLLDELSK